MAISVAAPGGALATDVVCDNSRGDATGWSVAAGADVNGDGIGDIVSGAPCAFVGGEERVGRAIVYSGADGKKLLSVKGEHVGQRLGSAVAIVGDLDGDGLGEIVVGSMGFDVPNGTNTLDAGGKITVYDVEGNIHFEAFGTSGGANCGEAVAGLPDVTGDGVPDILVGAGDERVDGEKKGKAFLISGADGTRADESQGVVKFDNWGAFVAAAPDVNNDQVADLLVATGQGDRPFDPENPDDGSEENNGLIKVVSGADLSEDLQQVYGAIEEKLGRSVVAAGDEGFLGGAIGTDVAGRTKAGTVTFFDWNGGVSLVASEPTPQVAANFGNAVAWLGNIDAGQAGEFAASAPNGTNNGLRDAGRVYAMRSTNGAVAWSKEGDTRGLRLGQSLAIGPDINGDDKPDLLIGAPGANPRGRRGAGAVIAVDATDGSELFRMNGRTGLETRIFVVGWRNGRMPHLRGFNFQPRRRGPRRDTFRRIADGELSVAMLDDAPEPTPGDLKVVLGTGHGSDSDAVLVVRAGRRSRIVSEIDAFDAEYTGGVNVASGNLLTDTGEDEILAVQADSPDGNVIMRAYQRFDEDLLGRIVWLQAATLTAFAAEDTITVGELSLPINADGANVAVGSVSGDGQAEIVVAPHSGLPVVRVLDRLGVQVAQWLAYFSDEDGVNVAIGDIDGDGNNEIITGPGSGLPRIRVFDGNGTPAINPETEDEISFFAFDLAYAGGVRVAVADVDLDGEGEILAATGAGTVSEVRAFEIDGTLVEGWEGLKPLGNASDRGVSLAATDTFIRH